MLTPGERTHRTLFILAVPIVLLAFKIISPDSIPRWFPLHTSCGAITGLPCIFCGMTRALHYLLIGNFGRALYFNWLAYPILAGTLGLFLWHATELTLGRKLVVRRPTFHLTRAGFSGALIGVVLLWCLQVYLAVSQHKTELLNPNGPLYSLVVR